MGAGAEPAEAEEEGRWEGREKTKTKGNCAGRGEDDYDNYSPTYPESEAAAVSSDLELPLMFVFGLRYAGSPLILRG